MPPSDSMKAKQNNFMLDGDEEDDVAASIAQSQTTLATDYAAAASKKEF